MSGQKRLTQNTPYGSKEVGRRIFSLVGDGENSSQYWTVANNRRFVALTAKIERERAKIQKRLEK
jgi:hypothetical protein